MSSYDPRHFSDDELLDVLWSMDARRFPERFELVRAEFAKRFPGKPIPTSEDQRLRKYDRELDFFRRHRVWGFRYSWITLVVFVSVASLLAMLKACEYFLR